MWINDVSLVLPDQVIDGGGLHIDEDGMITDIVDESNHSSGSLRASGLMVFPGLIDLHGDMLERELEPRPGALFPIDMSLYELDKRLACTGVTTAFAAISFWETERRKLRTDKTARQIIQTVNDLRPHLLVDFYIHARYEVSTPVVAPGVRQVIEAHQVHLVSLMDHTPGQGQYRDLERYYDFMAKWMDKPRDEVIAIAQQRLSTLPPAATILATAQEVSELARRHRLPLASHDDDTLAKVNLVASFGATISEFPVSLEAAQAAKGHGMHIIMGAPNALRDESTSGNLTARQGLAAGAVDILAADYHPPSLLQAAWALWKADMLPLPQAINLVSRNPAEAVGLSDRGSLAIGKQADLVLVEPGKYPRVRAVFRRGAPIYWDNYLPRLEYFNEQPSSFVKGHAYASKYPPLSQSA